MQTQLLLLIILLLGVFAVACAVELYRNLKAEIRDLKERMKKLESANVKRINVSSLEELEHAMAELAVLEMDNDLRGARIASVRTHLAKAHTPNSKTPK